MKIKFCFRKIKLKVVCRTDYSISTWSLGTGNTIWRQEHWSICEVKCSQTRAEAREWMEKDRCERHSEGSINRTWLPGWDRTMKIKNRCIRMLSHQSTVDLWKMAAKLKLNIQDIMCYETSLPWFGATRGDAWKHSRHPEKGTRGCRLKAGCGRKKQHVGKHGCKRPQRIHIWKWKSLIGMGRGTGEAGEAGGEEMAAGLLRSWWNLSFRVPPLLHPFQ